MLISKINFDSYPNKNMHKRVIMLTIASEPKEAISIVESFLTGYGEGNVYDWYAIGGRWSGLLGKEDSVLLKDCIDEVKKYSGKSMQTRAKEYWDKMLEEKAKENKQKSKGSGYVGTMSAYYARLYNDATYDRFSFESDVYDVDEYTNKIPKDLTNYYAVVVDLHN